MKLFTPEDFECSGDGPLRMPAHEIANAKLETHLANLKQINCREMHDDTIYACTSPQLLPSENSPPREKRYQAKLWVIE